MIPHRCTEITGENRASVFSAALCGIFFYDPTQRHGDHREKQSLRVLCGFVRDIGLRPSPESVIISFYCAENKQIANLSHIRIVLKQIANLPYIGLLLILPGHYL